MLINHHLVPLLQLKPVQGSTVAVCQTTTTSSVAKPAVNDSPTSKPVQTPKTGTGQTTNKSPPDIVSGNYSKADARVREAPLQQQSFIDKLMSTSDKTANRSSTTAASKSCHCRRSARCLSLEKCVCTG